MSDRARHLRAAAEEIGALGHAAAGRRKKRLVLATRVLRDQARLSEKGPEPPFSVVTPEMIAAAWAAWHARHGGKLGPGPAFSEAIKAALASTSGERSRHDGT